MCDSHDPKEQSCGSRRRLGIRQTWKVRVRISGRFINQFAAKGTLRADVTVKHGKAAGRCVSRPQRSA